MNRMPVSAARFAIGGRPPFGRSRAGGSNGSSTAHRSSGTRVFAMTKKRTKPRFVRCSQGKEPAQLDHENNRNG